MTFSRGFALDTLLDVRQDVQQFARDGGLADLRLYYFVVAVNEIMTNAIHHGGGRGQLQITLTGNCFRAQVVDQGPGIPADLIAPEIRPPANTLGGRGLWLTRQLCEIVDIRSAATGTTVTLEFKLNP
jgi:anti-sigma regulatory factor (Ser/Thr protein kinase)